MSESNSANADDENSKNSVEETHEKFEEPYSPLGIPLWGWGLILFVIFFLFAIAIYYMTGKKKPTDVSKAQLKATGGIMKTPGAI